MRPTPTAMPRSRSPEGLPVDVCVDCGHTAPVGPKSRCCIPCGKQRQAVSSRQWLDRNREKAQQGQRERYALNPKVENERSRRWKAANRERVAEYRRALYERSQKDTNSAKVADYRRRNPGKHAEIENRRRARLLGAFVEPIDPDEVWNRAGGVCQICGEPVERRKATIDHIIPLAGNGTHEPANAQLAHGPCNSRKGARVAS